MKTYLSLILVAAAVSTACFKVTTSPTLKDSTSTLLGGTWVTVESIRRVSQRVLHESSGR